jgi:hypothetical protein
MFILVDRVAVAIAENEVGDRIAAESDLPGAPEVDITGFPFLIQAATGSYDDVQLLFTAEDLGQPTGTGVDVRLRDVEVPLADVISGSVQQVPVGRIDGTATLSYALLSEEIGPGTELARTGDALQITRTVDIAGQELPLTATGNVRIDGGDLLIDVEGASGAGVDLPSVLVGQVSDLLGLRYTLPTLPFGLEISGVRPAAGGVVVSAEADGTVIGG